MEDIDRRSLIVKLVKSMRIKGSWAGETHIQKCVFFIQEMLGVPMGYEFVLYKHGAYSFELRSELASMRVDLQLDVEPRYPYGPSFTLGERGDQYSDRASEYDNAVQFVSQELAAREARDLERLSTAFFVQKTGFVSDDNEIASRVTELKPHISANAARDAVEEVNNLKSRAPKIPGPDRRQPSGPW